MEELKKIIEELVDGVKHILSMMEVEASAKMNSLEAKVEKATKRMNEAMLRELEVHEPFPCFDGSDPRGWIIKCLRFFRIYSGFTEHQKVVYATQHFEGKAEVWIQQLMKENLEWRGFVKAILCRFDNGDLFEDFRNLRQTSTVRKYTEEFEALCGLVIFVLEEEGSIDKYLMQCFISGLRAEFRATLRMFNPSDLLEAFRIAKLYETNVQDYRT
nr:Transposon Tf2-12 polyprotein [Ipomoea batatas]